MIHVDKNTSFFWDGFTYILGLIHFQIFL